MKKADQEASRVVHRWLVRYAIANLALIVLLAARARGAYTFTPALAATIGFALVALNLGFWILLVRDLARTRGKQGKP